MTRRLWMAIAALPPQKPHARWDKTCPPLPRPVPSASRNSPNASQPITLRFQDAWRLGLAATEYR